MDGFRCTWGSWQSRNITLFVIVFDLSIVYEFLSFNCCFILTLHKTIDRRLARSNKEVFLWLFFVDSNNLSTIIFSFCPINSTANQYHKHLFLLNYNNNLATTDVYFYLLLFSPIYFDTSNFDSLLAFTTSKIRSQSDSEENTFRFSLQNSDSLRKEINMFTIYTTMFCNSFGVVERVVAIHIWFVQVGLIKICK